MTSRGMNKARTLVSASILRPLFIYIYSYNLDDLNCVKRLYFRSTYVEWRLCRNHLQTPPQSKFLIVSMEWLISMEQLGLMSIEWLGSTIHDGKDDF